MKKLLLLTISAILLLAGCSKKQVEQAKNMEQLYAENGVPITITTVTPTDFSKELVYNANLTGIQQSSAAALVGGTIDTINYKIGDVVKKDDVVITFPLDNPSSQYRQVEAAYNNAKNTAQRMQNLFSSGGISQQDLDNVLMQLKVAEANLDAARQTLFVKAPIDGVITQINVRPTDNVSGDDILFVVARINKLKARLWAAENEIGQMQIGQPVSATWQSHTVTGKIVRCDLAMDSSTRAFGVDVELDNPDRKVLPGVSADLHIKVYHNPQALVLPRKLVLNDADGTYTWLAVNGQATRTNLVLGTDNGMNYEIKSGLKANDTVISQGYQLAGEGVKLNVRNDK